MALLIGGVVAVLISSEKGLVAGMAFLLLRMNGYTALNISVTHVAAGFVLWGKIPTPIIVLATLAAGILMPI